MKDFAGQKVVVTGASGFLGKRLVTMLEEEGATVIPYDITEGYDVRVYEMVKRFLYARIPDYVFHLAAQSIVSKSDDGPFATWELNVRGTWNVLEACRELPRLKGVVVSSSNHIYGRQHMLPTPEAARLNHLGAYSVSKIAADYITRCYGMYYEVPAVALRHTNTYGPSDIHDSHIIPGTIKAVLKGRVPVIHSAGVIKKGYLYEDDTARAYMTAALNAEQMAGGALNASSDESYSAQDLVTFIEKLMHSDLGMAVEGRPTSEENEYLDSALIKRFGWKQEVGLEEGIKKTIDAIRQQEGVLA